MTYKLPPHAAPKVPLSPRFKCSGLLKYDCPTPECTAWFVTYDSLDVTCNACQCKMIDTGML